MQIYKSMFFTLRKLLYAFFFNSCLFLLLIIGIQNSSNKSKVDLLIDETVSLPVGFIMGTSFIIGSIFGSFIDFKIDKKKINFL